MEKLPPFLRSLWNNPLISSIISAKKLEDIDLLDTRYQVKDNNAITLTDFRLNEADAFRMVDVLLTNYGILIDLFSDDTCYFDDAQFYFGSQAIGRSKHPYQLNGQHYNVKSKKIGCFQFSDHTMQCSVLSSELYGCKIMLSFY